MKGLSVARLLLAAVMLGVFPAPAWSSGPTLYHVRGEDSRVGFTITKWMVFREEGRFSDFRGTILYDPAEPSATRVELTVQAASIDSRNEDRDRALRSQEFFHVSRHPTLTFTSVRAEPAGDGQLLIKGDLTIRGITRRITVPVTVLGVTEVRNVGSLAGFESTFTIKRLDFRVGEGRSTLSEEVTIDLQIGASSVPATARR